jgi:hypothetical protein|eukprot:TRINITY_DN68643_c0_g1_i1.p1 TRINITY_DN68643_c0_g1~~TRINITY_DN68643_c0_g1_i1.p1  ORF type:complete len:383 (+),score=69.15 TRINITY_DN68643_c0_g1_i1:106-1149(+)
MEKSNAYIEAAAQRRSTVLEASHLANLEASAKYKIEDAKALERAMTKQFQKLKVALDTSDRVDPHNPFHTLRIMEVLKPIGNARDYVHGLIGTSDKEKLIEIFGGDCELIVALKDTACQVKVMLKDTNFESDPRLQECIDSCDVVEGVLISLGRLADKLEAARMRRRGVNPTEIDRMKIIAEIDEGETPEEKIQELFYSYPGATATGALTGDNYDNIMMMFAIYVADESRLRSWRLKLPGLAKKAEDIQDWVRGVIDPNNDLSITLDEAMTGFQKAVDDIDGKAEVRRRTLILEEKRLAQLAAQMTIAKSKTLDLDSGSARRPEPVGRSKSAQSAPCDGSDSDSSEP